MALKDGSKRLSLKRKLKVPSSAPRKKVKIEGLNIEDLPWKSVSRPLETGLGGDDGILELEEVEGVEVVYETTDRGKVAKFNVIENRAAEKENEAQPSENEASKKEDDDEDEDDENDDEEMVEAFDSKTVLPEWHSHSLHPQLERSLFNKKFLTPTPIQQAALPVALAGRDVIGIAQTGSGKTLAYGLPILHYLLNEPRPSSKRRRPLQALVLAPTRELALQVSSHITELLQAHDLAASTEDSPSKGKQAGGKKPPPRVSVAAIVGGMSAQKQRRILDRGIDILVATPGRLWDIIGDDDDLGNEIKNIRFLVLDEADRMIEAGHFAELENILRLTLREESDDQIPGEDGQEAESSSDNGKTENLQTFVFSATLSKDLQRNLKKRYRPKPGKLHSKRKEAPASTLDDLLLRLDFRDPDPEIIDLSPQGGVVSTLQEGRIDCLLGDKDTFLYYFLLRYPGRSLVFLSSIDGIRRLLPLLELLNVQAFPLHSQMEQRQRLKNLDRFKTIPNAVLLATDIAARGLDIPAVDHVIHFQIPRTADTYIHRNGRTARANRKGFSMLMCAPDERRLVKALMSNLGRDEKDIEEVDVELSMLDKLKERVQLARKIETALHKVKKTNHDRQWMQETAEALGVDLDSDFVSDEDGNSFAKQKQRAQDAKVRGMKSELKAMLSESLIARGVSKKFITSGSRPIVDDLLAGELNENMVGLKKTEAGSEMVKARKNRKQQLAKKH